MTKMSKEAKNNGLNTDKALHIADVSTRFLILSGEGGHQTEHQFVMELNTLEEANEHFDKLKKGEFNSTYLFIYEAKKLREE